MERQEKCPKCGTDRPKPGDTFTTDWAGYLVNNKSIKWIAEVKAEERVTTRECSCQSRNFFGTWKFDWRCKKCEGDGTYQHTESIEAAPEHMLIHCDACGYSWKEPPLDSKEE